jgi:Nif11 domain
MSKQGLEALRARVNDDPELALRLHGVEPARFAAEVVHIADELGLEVAERDVDDAVARGRLSWTTRWLR